MSTNSMQVTTTSYEEALSILRDLQSIDLNTTPYSPELIAHGISRLTELVANFQKGEVLLEPRSIQAESAYNTKHVTSPVEKFAEQQNLPEPESLKPKKAVLPNEFKDIDSIPISKMDWEALQKVIPTGRITPPTPSVFYIAQELKLPVPEGFVRNITHLDTNFSPRPITNCSSTSTNKAAVKIEFVGRSRSIIPMPIGCGLANIEQVFSKVACPQPSDPLVWKTKEYFQKISYAVATSTAPEFTSIDLKALMPSKAEQEYFKSMMLLPRDLDAEIRRSPDDILQLIAAYLAKKTEKSGTLFRYVCNPYLSDFIQAHKNDLPLIVHELKVGHCDLLAWYVAAQLRAYGMPAWVASGLVTIPDGSAFNAAYGHSVVVTADKSGKLFQFDPTTAVEIDLGYHPDVLTRDDIQKLDIDFVKAKTTAKKRVVLQKFFELMSKKSADAKSNSKTRESLSNVRSMYLQALSGMSTPGATLDQSSHVIRAKHASWSALPDKMGLSEIRQVALELGEKDKIYLMTADLADRIILAEREKDGWLCQALRTHKVQIGIESIPLSEEFFEGSFSLADYCDAEEFDFSLGSCLNLSSANIQAMLDYFSATKRLHSFDLNSLVKSNLGKLSINYTPETDLFIKLLNDPKIAPDFLDLLDSHTFGFDRGFIYKHSIDDIIKPNELAAFSVNFFVKFQQALFNPEKRKVFCEEFQCGEQRLVELTYSYLRIKQNKPRYLTKEKLALNTKVKKTAFYLHPDDETRIQRNFIKALKQIDINQAHGTTTEEVRMRLYSPGDDSRKINWKAWGKTDKFYVTSSPEITQGIHSPIYILLGESLKIHINVTEPEFHLVYYVTALQKEMKKSGREIYVGTVGGDVYFRLRHNDNPEAFLNTLYQRNRFGSEGEKANPFRIRTKSGAINSGNFLLVSRDYTEIACLHYLASRQPRTKLHYVYTDSPEFEIYPLLKDEWVEKGEDFFK